MPENIDEIQSKNSSINEKSNDETNDSENNENLFLQENYNNDTEDNKNENENIVLYYKKNYLNRNFRFGKKADYVEGNWFLEFNSIFTYNTDDVAAFYFPYIKEGNYKIKITAKRWSSFKSGIKEPAGFKKYKIKIETDYDKEAFLYIKASSKKMNNGETEIYINGPTYVYVTWVNHCFGINFQLYSIRITKTLK